MKNDYSLETCLTLRKQFADCNLHRPMNIDRYEEGDELCYEATAINDPSGSVQKITLVIERFVGGGFAGQVYKVRIVTIENGTIGGLQVNGIYAMKILIPPSKGSLFFRNIMYGIGFQGPFQLQTNPAAARSGAIWQKFIRRGAKIRLKDEQAVNDIHATFVDQTLGSCGEISDWVEGRTWRLEVDEHLDELSRWKRGKKYESEKLGSPEFRAKRTFMKAFVDLLHDMGAHEFARQYEWSTWKSQPNCLKRVDSEGEPGKGLMAVDFRAGLALLPFVPMSPGDVPLIFQGISRGSLVQFDRGNIGQLESFIEKHKDAFTDLLPMLEELKEAETIYRNSVPDITHNHVRLLFSKQLWSTMLKSTVQGWKIRNYIDKEREASLQNRSVTVFFLRILLCLPLFGLALCKLFNHQQWQKHYQTLLTNLSYLKMAIRGKIIEKSIGWYRTGRVSQERALSFSHSFLSFLLHLPFSFLPIGMNKFFTDWSYCKERLDYILLRPVRLYFNAKLREDWLREMVADGQKKHIISKEDAGVILSRINEPFIQKYLKSLAVHVCTVPITQVVSVLIAIIYVLTHPDMPRAQSWSIGLGIIALFQVIPISPGSLTRGLYVLYLVIKERNFKDYNIAVFLGFFKYIGYLAFPIQMTYKYPTLARFMAGYWATEAVHVVPVFGESGALLEHFVFNLFYNWPLTIRRRMREKIEARKALKPRYWHVPIYVAFAAALFGCVDYFYMYYTQSLPTLKSVAPFIALIPFVFGSIVASGSGGASLARRVIVTAFGGIAIGICYTGISTFFGFDGSMEIGEIVVESIWRMFVITIPAVCGALFSEVR